MSHCFRRIEPIPIDATRKRRSITLKAKKMSRSHRLCWKIYVFNHSLTTRSLSMIMLPVSDAKAEILLTFDRWALTREREVRRWCYLCSLALEKVCTMDYIRNSNLIPIIVGICLAVLVVVVLVAYLIGRRRNRNGYQSVWKSESIWHLR